MNRVIYKEDTGRVSILVTSLGHVMVCDNEDLSHLIDESKLVATTRSGCIALANAFRAIADRWEELKR